MTYTKNREGYLIPSLSLPNQPNPYLNRYARLRLEYLEQNEPTLCDQLMLEGTLLTSCNRIGRTAQQMVDKTLRELMQATPMPDRRTNPLGWAQLTNSLKKQAEEAHCLSDRDAALFDAAGAGAVSRMGCRTARGRQYGAR